MPEAGIRFGLVMMPTIICSGLKMSMGILIIKFIMVYVLDVHYEGRTRNQSRVVEQWEIENGPSHQNISNSISKDHRYYDAAKAWAAKNKDNYRKG